MTLFQGQIDTRNGEKSKDIVGYERLLRVIGQALEKHRFSSFELTPAGEGFFIRGQFEPAPKGSLTDRTASRIRSLLDRMPNRGGRDGIEPGFPSSGAKGPSELLLTLDDIERLDADGRARRVDSQQMVNTSSLPQVLRCLGAYLNQKRASLLKLSSQGDELLLEYQTSLGSRRQASFSATAIYDIWVRMYLQRAGRASQ